MSKFKIGDIIVYKINPLSPKYTIIEVKSKNYIVKAKNGSTYTVPKSLLENNYKLISKRAAHPLTNIFN